MLATLNDRESTVKELTHMEQCPLDFKQMKVSYGGTRQVQIIPIEFSTIMYMTHHYISHDSHVTCLTRTVSMVVDHGGT